MRKSILFLTVSVVVLAMFSFTSCKKKDGVFNPEKKIHKVYHQQFDYYESSKETKIVEEKRLAEIWRWDKNKLIQIESGYGWTSYFTYDGKQLSKIEIGEDQVINFKYDKAELKTIDVLDDKGRSTLLITAVERDGERITKYTMEIFSHNNDPETSSKLLSAQIQPIMQLIFFDPMANFICENIAQVKAQKATTSIILTCELLYEGNNVKEQKFSQTVGNTTVSETYVFQYDTKKNPSYNSLHLSGFDGLSGQSENNIIKYYNKEDHDYVTEFEYEYSGDYPSKRTRKYEILNMDGKRIRSLVDFYEYQSK